jgi:hypothetical protein
MLTVAKKLSIVMLCGVFHSMENLMKFRIEFDLQKIF